MFRPDRRIPFVDAVYRVIAGEDSLADVSILLCNLEEKHRVFLRPVGDRPLIPNDESDAWITEHLRPFLDETHLVISGADLSDEIDVCDDHGRQLGASHRAWGHILADWANDRSWPDGLSQPVWTYLNFYANGPPVLGYDDFVRVVIQAVHLP